MTLDGERHWNAFREGVPWFVRNRPNVRPVRTLPPGSWTPKDDEFVSLFPSLTALLAAAWVTEVRLLSEAWTLYSWEVPGAAPSGWLSPQAGPLPGGIHPHHEALLRSFSGITETFGDPDSWIANHTAVLTPELAGRDATFVEAAAWAFEETGGIPLVLSDYRVVAEEANGNATLCHRKNGDVLLFAPDHALDYVTVLEGCPEYTFYRLQGAPTFAAWVNVVAGQWAAGPNAK